MSLELTRRDRIVLLTIKRIALVVLRLAAAMLRLLQWVTALYIYYRIRGHGGDYDVADFTATTCLGILVLRTFDEYIELGLMWEEGPEAIRKKIEGDYEPTYLQ